MRTMLPLVVPIVPAFVDTGMVGDAAPATEFLRDETVLESMVPYVFTFSSACPKLNAPPSPDIQQTLWQMPGVGFTVESDVPQ
jgi:hypothetical protein